MILELLGVSELLNKMNLGGKLLMSIASNMCNFKMGKKMSDDARLDKGIE
jgi:hypothetical protein